MEACLLGRSVLVLLGLLAGTVHGVAQADESAAFTPAQLSHVRSLGPWPPAWTADPANRVSGDPRAVELGRRLFRDPRMSPVGYIACVTCHQPDRAFTDRRARAHGLADLPRNTPTLANLRQQRWYGWDGASDSLWLASVRPMLDPREFDGNPTSITRIYERDPDLAACYAAVFGTEPVRDAQETIVNTGKALAAFQETMVTGRTAFDRYRDALLRNDASAMAAYPAPARRGLRLFVGPAGCVACHRGPNLSDGQFHAVLDPAAAWFGDDDGRLGGADRLRANPMNLLGRFNDDATRANAQAVERLVVRDDMRDRFRTPSLRNVGVTAPYMHDGRHDRLVDALDHGASAVGTTLGAAARDDLLAFLVTLTDEHGERRPWSTEPLARCP